MTVRGKKGGPSGQGEGVLEGGTDFTQCLLRVATNDKPRIEFLSDALMLVHKHADCHAVELRLKDREDILACEAYAPRPGECAFRIVSRPAGAPGLEEACAAALAGIPRPLAACCTEHGTARFGETRPIPGAAMGPEDGASRADAGGRHHSFALVPLSFDEARTGLLLFKSVRRQGFSLQRIGRLETIAAKFELALRHHLAQSRLRERVKELTCLYGIAQIASNPALSFERQLEEIVRLLPAAWQYPHRASARIIADGVRFETGRVKDGPYRQEAPIRAGGRDRGAVEIHYDDGKPFLQRSPFLDEEQRLIDNIAGQIAHMIERQEAAAARSALEEQLIRADRMAAIGQLAAGVAHELNEPLNTILGFAQLARKARRMPRQTLSDIGKIADAALHARRIIRELLIFARQAAPDRACVSLNRIVADELSLFETLCRKSGVALRRNLALDLPEITADKSQILQVVSNLIVNALQAMPDGGVLTLQTSFNDATVCLTVADTGIGMHAEIQEKIFLPFFTTKDVNEGTGLGLSVVHGIVSAHNGGISVESEEGKGTRFLVTFPIGGIKTHAENVR